jgi:hypothetical protein
MLAGVTHRLVRFGTAFRAEFQSHSTILGDPYHDEPADSGLAGRIRPTDVSAPEDRRAPPPWW